MIKYLETENFDDLVKNGIHLVDFYAEWCGPCKMMGNVLENVDFVDIIKINTDNRPDLAQRFGVMSIPTLIVFKDGELISQSVGFKDIDEIKEMIQN